VIDGFHTLSSDCKWDLSSALWYLKRFSKTIISYMQCTFRGGHMAMARWELHALQPAPCTLFHFDIRFIANQTINSSGRGYLNYPFTESMYSLLSTHFFQCNTSFAFST